ncbi:hypothetical protein F4778DRAFT_775971 [Xylariomycetidae sp. FL2044]|nr:hypothetical protein F4778DRAFT_775971 [Xylariomycetidae sp. FL2044]
MPEYQNKQIYLPPSGEFEIRTRTEPYVPEGSQSLVRVQYSAINPADFRHYWLGWHSYITGYDFLGTVEATGPSSPFAVGDTVYGLAMPGDHRPIHVGAHQDFLLADPFNTFRLSSSSSPLTEDDKLQAVSRPAAVLTAIDALFNVMGFAFPPLADGPEKIDGVDPKGRPLLIWGASSQVGLQVLNLARFAGFAPIYATASPRNHEALRAAGATACFDYRDPDVVPAIRAAARAAGVELATVFDAVSAGLGAFEPPRAPGAEPLDLGQSSPALAKRCLSDGARDVRLSATLPVAFDPAWRFCLSVRLPRDPSRPLPDDPTLVEVTAEPEYARRYKPVRDWIFDNHEAVGLRVPNVRIVKGAEEGVKAIYDVFAGKASFEKVLIEHPM